MNTHCFARLTAAFMLAGCVVMPVHASSLGTWTLEDISGGGSFRYALALNNAGAVTGYTDSGSGAWYHSPMTGLVHLGNPDLPGQPARPGRSGSSGLAINELGEATGRWSNAGHSRGFRYAPGAGLRDMGAVDIAPHGINDAGRVAGMAWLGDRQVHFTAEQDDTVTVHDTAVPVWSVVGLRNDDVIVANRWNDVDNGYSMAGLIQGDSWYELPLGDVNYSHAAGFNEQGMVVGARGRLDVETSTFVESAYAYSPTTGMLDLAASMPANVTFSSAVDVNERGWVIGRGMRGSGTTPFSFVHDLGTGTFVDLATALARDTPAGWTDIIPTAINDRGQIAGWGIYQGQERAILLTQAPVPEAGTVPMLWVGAASIAWMVRRRRVALARRPA